MSAAQPEKALVSIWVTDRGRVSVTSETQNVNVPISTEVRRFGKAMSVSEEQP